jgi:hypothetical protein
MKIKKKLLRAIDAVEELAVEMRQDYSKVTNEVGRLQKELDCAEDYGHEYVFVEKAADGTKIETYGRSPLRDLMVYGTSMMNVDVEYCYRYKCSRCGRTVDYTWDELSTKEKNALKTLGVVKP